MSPRRNQTVFIAGRSGLVGSALERRLRARGYHRIIGPNSSDLDLCDAQAVATYYDEHRPDWVFMAAAKVGGIYANNTYPADFIVDNLQIQVNLIHNAYLYGVKKLLFLGSSCIYPKFAPQPLKEEYLLTGPLEPTNEPYAIAKIAGIKTCQSYNRQYGTNFISVMPTNLYGLRDNYDPMNSHVLPALIRRFHEAKMMGEPQVVVWGTGTARREFMFADDMADACVHLMEVYRGNDIVNIGSGQEVTIETLARKIRDVVGYEGEIVFDHSKPDGTPRKLLDLSRLHAAGWDRVTPLREGIAIAYADFVSSGGRAGNHRPKTPLVNALEPVEAQG